MVCLISCGFSISIEGIHLPQPHIPQFMLPSQLSKSPFIDQERVVTNDIPLRSVVEES